MHNNISSGGVGERCLLPRINMKFEDVSRASKYYELYFGKMITTKIENLDLLARGIVLVLNNIRQDK